MSVARSCTGRDTTTLDCESGVISSWNDQFVFVRYGGKQTSQATSPSDLDFEFQKRSKR